MFVIVVEVANSTGFRKLVSVNRTSLKDHNVLRRVASCRAKHILDFLKKQSSYVVTSKVTD